MWFHIFTDTSPHPSRLAILKKMMESKGSRSAKKAAKNAAGNSVKDSSDSSSSHEETTAKQKPNATSNSPPSAPSFQKKKKIRGSGYDDESDEYEVKRVHWDELVLKQDLAERADVLAALKSARVKFEEATGRLNTLVDKGDFKSRTYKHWCGEVQKLEASIEKLEERSESYRESANNVQAKMSTMSYKLSASIPGGLKYPELRRDVFKLARGCFAYDHKIYYRKVGKKGKTQITAESPLKAELYFKNEDNARRMEIAIKNASKTYDDSADVVISVVKAPDHTCTQRVSKRTLLTI